MSSEAVQGGSHGDGPLTGVPRRSALLGSSAPLREVARQAFSVAEAAVDAIHGFHDPQPEKIPEPVMESPV
jgi:hypothetical protein